MAVHTATALSAAQELPEQERKKILPIVLALDTFARLQDIVNRRAYEAVTNLPAEHASTHKGGSDDVAGTEDPSEVEFGNVADPGDATAGFAPIDHVHPLGDELESLSGLADVSTDTIDGASVQDVNVRRLLEEIFVLLLDIEKRL